MFHRVPEDAVLPLRRCLGAVAPASSAATPVALACRCTDLEERHRVYHPHHAWVPIGWRSHPAARFVTDCQTGAWVVFWKLLLRGVGRPGM